MYKILGIQNVNYTNKANRKISGVRLHCSTEDNRVEGFAVEQIFVSSSVTTESFTIGQEIDVLYNKYGSVERIYPL